MSLIWTDEGRHVPEDVQPKQPSYLDTARTRRLAALEALAQRRARGETEMITRARRRHERLKQRFDMIK